MAATLSDPTWRRDARTAPARVAGFATFVAAVLLACLPAAPAAARVVDDHFVETWTTRDGLPHSQVHGIGQTSDGYLWLATWEGIARYNGHDFRLFRRGDVPGLGDDGVRAMHVGPRGDLWVGSTRGGIVQWRDGRWLPHAGVDGLVTDLLEGRGGGLWVATARGGVVHVDRAGHRTSITMANGLPSDTVNALVADGRGRVWAATSHGLARIHSDRAVAVAGTGLPAGPVFSLAVDAQGRVLAGTESGAYIGDGTRFAMLHAGLAGHTATRLWPDAGGVVWVGTNNRGLARLHDGRLDWLDARGGLPNDRVLALRRDTEGGLWVGTNGGLARLRHAPIRTYTQRDGFSDDFVRSTLAARDGGLWVGSGKGLDRFDVAAGTVQSIALGTQAHDVSVLSLAEDAAGDILAGTFHHGLLRVRAGRVVETVSMAAGLPSNEVRAIVAARDGTVWIGTKQGLVARGPRGVRVFGVREGLPAEYVQALHEDADGAIWVGTGLGAARVVGDAVRRVDLARSGAHYVYGFHPATGGMWLATDRGLVRVDRLGRATHQVGRAAGLPFEKIFAIVQDARGHVWLTGNEGIARVSAARLDAHVAGTTRSLEVSLYGRADGMLSAQANGGSMPAATLDANGHLWVATAIGAARLDPAARSRRPAAPPPVVIERFEVDGRPVDPRDRPELPAGDHRFVVRFVAPTLLDAQRVRYRYRLDGMDARWIDLGTAREVQFTHLDPGAFRLHLEASVPGVPRASRASVEFSIRAYWWQRPVLWVALGVLALLAVYGGVRLRTRQLRLSQARLRALVEERTAALRIQTQVAESLARTDSLTRLANRRALDQALEHELVELSEAHPFSLVLLDVDGFKPINDLYSHAAGDRALQAVAAVLDEHARAQDIASRWGGDEFALLLVDCTFEQGLAVAERIREAVEAIDCSPFAPGLGISASIGVASTQHRGGRSSLRTLVPRADEALYRAKREGRNRVRAALEPEVAL